MIPRSALVVRSLPACFTRPCSSSSASSSTSTSSDSKKKKTFSSKLSRWGKQDGDVLSYDAKLGKKHNGGLFGTSTVPININYPNKRGIPGLDDQEEDLGEVLQDGPEILRKEFKKLRKELPGQVAGSVEKTEMMEQFGILKDNEARVEYRFDSDEAMSLWQTGCDSAWGEGFSTCTWERTDRATAMFSGNLSSRIVKDGRIERAGWASFKLEDRAAFHRKKFLRRWGNFSHLLIKCRGDGRSYKVMLHAPLTLDVTWGDSFSYPLHTHGGPYWQYERIPFSKFFHTVAGRIQDRQYPVNMEDVSSISIVLMDRVDGPFQLEMDWIGVVHDRSHIEKFAYETYTLPVFNTHGF